MKTQTDLANFLKIKSGPVSDAKRRDAFPLDWAFKIAQSYKLSSDWILTGKHPPPSGELYASREGVVREDKSEITIKTKTSVLKKKLDFIMQNGNPGQHKTLSQTVEDLYDEIFLESD